MATEFELIARAEAVLDRTLAYHAAMAVHELKVALGIDIQQINLAVSPVANDGATFRVVCTIVSAAAQEPLEVELIKRAVPHQNG
jgi:hypothetical protein